MQAFDLISEVYPREMVGERKKSIFSAREASLSSGHWVFRIRTRYELRAVAHTILSWVDPEAKVVWEEFEGEKLAGNEVLLVDFINQNKK